MYSLKEELAVLTLKMVSCIVLGGLVLLLTYNLDPAGFVAFKTSLHNIGVG